MNKPDVVEFDVVLTAAGTAVGKMRNEVVVTHGGEGSTFEMVTDEAAVREWTIGVEIRRAGEAVFSGETSISNIKRTFDELAGYLCRSQTFSQGVLLLTGTGVVPGDAFTLVAGDEISVRISGIGELTNSVIVV